MPTRFRLNFEPILDAHINPLAFGTITFYQSGTEIPTTIYSDAAGTIPKLNPVTLDTDGKHSDIWLSSSMLVRAIVRDAEGAVVPGGDIDPVVALTTEAPIEPPFAIYDVPIYIQGVMADAEVFPIFNIVRALRLPALLAGTKATIGVNPAAILTLTLKKNGSSIGTIAFSTIGTPTITFAADVNFAIGDQFSVAGQATHDTTGAQIAITFVFTVL